MTCPAILGGYDTGLLCIREDAHTTHSFQSSAVSDRHTAEVQES